MVKLLINTHQPREIFERDWKGEMIPLDQATTVCVEITNALVRNGSELAFRVAVRVPKARCVQRDDALLLATGCAVHWLPGWLSSTSYIDFYGIERIDYTDSPAADRNALVRRHEAEVWPKDALMSAMAAAAEYNDAVRAQFERSKETLVDFVFNNMPAGFQFTLGEARCCLDHIRDVLACSGALGGYTDRDARNALRSYEELARRKVANNHNYRVKLDDVKRFSMGLYCPDVWGRRPPLRS